MRARIHNLLARIELRKVAAIVMTSIVLEKTKKARAKIIEKWIEVGNRCQELDNLSSPVAIMVGLDASPVSRLKKTWSVRHPSTLAFAFQC
jgi:son of sevenless-like protein